MWGQPPSAVRRAKSGLVLILAGLHTQKASFARWTAEGGCPHMNLIVPP
jgi:hypothetical protein